MNDSAIYLEYEWIFQYICALQGCHHFLAGDALRSKSRYAALDETAVFGSICKHEFPQRFINLKHGEQFDLLCM